MKYENICNQAHPGVFWVTLKGTPQDGDETLAIEACNVARRHFNITEPLMCTERDEDIHENATFEVMTETAYLKEYSRKIFRALTYPITL